MKPATPRVSVLIATHNRPDYLRGAIASVLLGAYAEFEVIVSDDAGPPHNRAVVESFADPRVHYRRNPERLGIAGNHLAAARDARGDYVAVLNDDDVWEPELLATLAPLLDANVNLAVAFADHHIIDADGALDAAATASSSRRWKRDRLADREYGNRDFQRIALVDQSIAIVAALFRRSAIDWSDFPLETGPAYDLWLTYLACRGGGAAWYASRRLARFRVHRESASVLESASAACAAIFIYSRLSADPALAHWRRLFAARLKYAHLRYALALSERGGTKSPREHLWLALCSKHGPRAALAMALSFVPDHVRANLLRRTRAILRGAIRSSRKSAAVARWR
ncbi:MAG TPA: glycosyltransferase family 2 protein [Candidatus Binataceae bacterium]|nr:glycosyltransferase family 2 protein [Candidatus Binataceae bacterium]